MSNEIKHTLRLEVRLSVGEMGTLDKRSTELGIGKSEYVRTLLKKDKNTHEKGEQITDEQIKRFMTVVKESINTME